MTVPSAEIRFFRPNAVTIARFLAAQSDLPFSYSAVGCTEHSTVVETGPSPGYVLDHNRAVLGFGADTFQHAAAALCHWGMFDIGWVTLHHASPRCGATLPAVGTTVCVLARVLGLSSTGLWMLNACRVQRLIDSPPTDVEPRRFGFAYGTLPGHIERGEERFVIEHSLVDNSVTFDLLAISQPAHWLAKVGRPIARMYQKRFARDSLRAMQRLVDIAAEHAGKSP